MTCTAAHWVDGWLINTCCVVVQINARRINDELNVFKDLHKSPIFLGVLIITAGLQVRTAHAAAAAKSISM